MPIVIKTKISVAIQLKQRSGVNLEKSSVAEDLAARDLPDSRSRIGL